MKDDLVDLALGVHTPQTPRAYRYTDFNSTPNNRCAYPPNAEGIQAKVMSKYLIVGCAYPPNAEGIQVGQSPACPA